MGRRGGGAVEEREGPAESLGDLAEQQQAEALREARRGGETPQARAERTYRMPPVHVGMAVLWRPEPGTEPCPAVVTKVGQKAIGLSRIVDGGATLGPRDGCRHESDPSLARMLDPDAGVWDYTIHDRELMSLAERVGAKFLDNDPDALPAE